jgi:hypothetical protein
MATYYVRNDGSDANSGLGPATNQAWATIQKALGPTSGLVGGDIVYVAPGRYTEYVNVTITSPSSQVRIVGDPSASQFASITPGVVLWTVMTASGANITTYLLTGTSKSNLSFENFYFEMTNTFNNQYYMNLGSCQNIQFKKCLIDANGSSTNTNILSISCPSGQALNATIDSCIFNYGAQQLQLYGTSGVLDSTVVKNCLFIGSKSTAFLPTSINVDFVNNTVIGAVTGIVMNPNSSIPSTIRNSLFVSCITAGFSISNVGTTVTYSRAIGGGFSNMTAATLTNSFVGGNGLDNGYRQMHNLQSIFQSGSTLNSVNTSFGNTIGAPTTDLFGVAWSGTSPDAGAVTFRNLGTITPIYQPTERTNNSFTVSPNTTNRSELIYLGAKGITHTTPSLSASYVRAGAIRTAITLVSQTPNGSWTSGGFCEIDSTNMPGIYRIDVPNAVFVAGAESAILQLTGANTSNGAVVHYNMAKVQFDLSQNVPLSNTAHSIGDALNAARAQGFGKWQIVGNTMNIYAEDGITLVKSFALDSGSYPTQRM